MFGTIDWDDRILGVIFLLSSAVSVGLVTVPGTTIFTDTLFSIGSGGSAAVFSIAKIISAGSFLAVVVTNRTDFSKLAGVEYWAAITTLGLIIFPPFMPLLNDLMTTTVVGGATAIVIQAGGFAVVSYLG